MARGARSRLQFPTDAGRCYTRARAFPPEVSLGLFSFLKESRRKRLLARYPLAEDLWLQALEEHPILHGLDDEELARLKEHTTLFLAEKEFFFSPGSEVSDAMTLSIAVQACLPILNLGIHWYDDWNTIILTHRRVTRSENARWIEARRGSGVRRRGRGRGPGTRSGGLFAPGRRGFRLGATATTWSSTRWPTSSTEGPGAIDGCPPLPGGMDPRVWKKSFGDAYERFKVSLDRGSKSSLLKRIDSYAAEHPSEFFRRELRILFRAAASSRRGPFPTCIACSRSFSAQDPASRRRRGPQTNSGR